MNFDTILYIAQLPAEYIRVAHPPDQLFKIFLEESGRLCEKSLRTSLEDSPPTYSARSFGDIPYVDFMHFSEKKFGYTIPALSLKDALSNPGLLRNYLSPALGLSNTGRLYSIIMFFFLFFCAWHLNGPL